MKNSMRHFGIDDRQVENPYVCVGGDKVALVIEVYLGAAIKILKGEPRLIVRLNIFLGRCPAFCERKLEIKTLLRKFLQQFMK